MSSYTNDDLRSWGIAGNPLRMAPETAAVTIGAIRQANLDPAAVGAATDLIASLDPDLDPAQILVAGPPVGTFTFADVSDDEHPLTFEFTSDDAALDIGDSTRWSFGDGSPDERGGVVSHSYGWDGVFTVGCEVALSGMVFRSTQDVTAGDPVVAEPVVQGGPRLGFEPDDHTVTEVQDYINSCAEGDRVAEARAVLDLEVAGKNRSTLVSWLEAVVAGETD